MALGTRPAARRSRTSRCRTASTPPIAAATGTATASPARSADRPGRFLALVVDDVTGHPCRTGRVAGHLAPAPPNKLHGHGEPIGTAGRPRSPAARVAPPQFAEHELPTRLSASFPCGDGQARTRRLVSGALFGLPQPARFHRTPPSLL